MPHCGMPITIQMYTKGSDGPRIIAEYGQEYGKDCPVCVLYDCYRHYDAQKPSHVHDCRRGCPHSQPYSAGIMAQYMQFMKGTLPH